MFDFGAGGGAFSRRHWSGRKLRGHLIGRIFLNAFGGRLGILEVDGLLSVRCVLVRFVLRPLESSDQFFVLKLLRVNHFLQFDDLVHCSRLTLDKLLHCHELLVQLADLLLLLSCGGVVSEDDDVLLDFVLEFLQ